MKEDIKKYAKVGLVHHLLYPQSEEDPIYHIKSLLDFLNAYDIETFDCMLPFGEDYRAKLVPQLNNCGKEIAYCSHISLLSEANPASGSYLQQGLTRIFYEDQIKAAESIGAAGYVFNSGKKSQGETKAEALKNFSDFCIWFCKKLSKTKIMAMIEPFDTSVDKKFLLGPTSECAHFVNSSGIENLGIELDFAHVPLLGESFYEAVKNTHKHLKRVHLGNCILKDRSCRWYGDKHPPIGMENGEIDTQQLAEILTQLLKFGYLNKKRRGALVLEARPVDGMGPEELVADNFKRLYDAWDLI